MKIKPQHVIEEFEKGVTGFSEPIPFRYICKIDGPNARHIEQLWYEIKSLKIQIKELKKNADN